MDALVIGTGGAGGWPEDGCRCASCMRARAAGERRAPGRVLVGERLEVVPGQPLQPGTGPSPAAALRIEQLPGGFDITSLDGSRLLLAAGPAEVPEPRPGASPYDLALLDLLGDPAQLGRLRASGLVHGRTAVAALYTDHRVSSPEEMARRCVFWGARQAQDGQLISGPCAADCTTASLRPHRTLIIGGARSGKSTEAERRLAAEPAVAYVGSGPVPACVQGCGLDWAGWRARHRVGAPRRPPPGAPAVLVANGREPGSGRHPAGGGRRFAHRRHRHLACRGAGRGGHVV